MSKKGLGTGLGALFGDAAIDDLTSDDILETVASQSTAMKNDFEYVPLRRIEPDGEQPRSLFEQEKIDELADSIREHGVLSPILVRRLDNGYYKIIAGERRWRAARAAELSEMPVRILTADDKNALEIALVENLQRENLNPIEEARGFQALLNEFDMTQEEVGQRVGRSRPAITNAIRLLSLPEELTDLIASGKLPAGSARALMGLKNQDDLLKTAHSAIKKEMSVREVEHVVKTMNAKAAPDDKKEQDSKEDSATGKKYSIMVDYTLEAQKCLTSALGRRVTIRRNQNKGTIEIDFHDKDDFNALFDALIDFGKNHLVPNKKGDADHD